jgi:hypothetical protein
VGSAEKLGVRSVLAWALGLGLELEPLLGAELESVLGDAWVQATAQALAAT